MTIEWREILIMISMKKFYNQNNKNKNVLTLRKYCISGGNKGKKAQIWKRTHIWRIILVFQERWTTTSTSFNIVNKTNASKLTSQKVNAVVALDFVALDFQDVLLIDW